MKELISSTIKRVQRYHFENGLFELLFGIIFFFCGILVKPLPFPSFPTWLSIACLILAPFAVLYLWSRNIYPRTGYINNLPATMKNRFLRVLPVFALELALALLVLSPLILVDSGSNGDGGTSWTTLTFGLVMSLIFVFLGIRSGLYRLIIIAVISAGLAVGLSPIILSNQTYYFSNPQFPYWVVYASQIFITVYFILMSLVFVFSGGLAFLNYLRANPLPAETDNGQ